MIFRLDQSSGPAAKPALPNRLVVQDRVGVCSISVIGVGHLFGSFL